MRFSFRLGFIVVAAAFPTFARAQAPVRLAAGTELATERSVLDLPARLVIDEVPRVTALTRLSESSGVALAFSATLLGGFNQKVSCDCERASVRDALARLLGDTPLRYRVLDGQIVITPQPPPAPRPDWRPSGRPLIEPVPEGRQYAVPPGLQFMRRDGSIAGVVIVSASGRPLAGAQIAVDGTALRAIADVQGRFRFPSVGGDRATLRVTMLGYKPLLRIVTVGDEAVRLTLVPAPIGLEAVVVTASGEQRLREVGSAIERVRADSAALTAPATNWPSCCPRAPPGCT